MASVSSSLQKHVLLRLLVANILALGQHLSCVAFSSCTCRFAFGAEKHLLFPLKSPPELQSTNIDGNYDYKLVLSLTFRIIRVLSDWKIFLLVTTHFKDWSGRRRLQRNQRDSWDPADRTKELRLRTPHRVATPSWPTSCWPEEAHRPPRGKRPPETEINDIKESIFFCPKHETLDLWN